MARVARMVRVLKSLAFLGTSLKRTCDPRRSATLPLGGLFLRCAKSPSSFDIDSVKSYLIDSPEKAFDGQSLRCYKQLRAYQLFDERHVHDLEANLWEKGEHFYFVRAECWPSQWKEYGQVCSGNQVSCKRAVCWRSLLAQRKLFPDFVRWISTAEDKPFLLQAATDGDGTHTVWMGRLCSVHVRHQGRHLCPACWLRRKVLDAMPKCSLWFFSRRLLFWNC